MQMPPEDQAKKLQGCTQTENLNVCCHLMDRCEQHLYPRSLVSEVNPKEHTSFRPGEESILKANPSPVYLGFRYSTPSSLKEMRCHVIYNNMAVILNQLKPETDYFPPGGKTS